MTTKGFVVIFDFQTYRYLQFLLSVITKDKIFTNDTYKRF